MGGAGESPGVEGGGQGDETAASEEGCFVDEADGVAERVVEVERTLAPGTGLGAVVEPAATGAGGALVRGLEVVGREVDVVGVGAERLEGCGRVRLVVERLDTGEDDAVAVEVVARGGHALARLAEQAGIEGGAGFEVGDGDDHAEDRGGGHGSPLSPVCNSGQPVGGGSGTRSAESQADALTARRRRWSLLRLAPRLGGGGEILPL